MMRQPSHDARAAVGRATPTGRPNRLSRLRSQVRELFAFWWSDSARRTQLFVLVACLWLAIFANQWLRIDREIAGARQAVSSGAETAYVAPVPVLRMASLGHQSFVADLLFVRVAHYFVRHLITDSRMPWLDLYLDAIWGLDAHNKTTYRWAAQVVKFGQRIDNDVAVRANRFARLGLEYFPQDAWLYHEIAFNLHSHMVTDDPLERKRLSALALDYLAIAYRIPGFSFDPNYLSHQYSRAGRIDDAVEAAIATYAQATAEQRRELRRRLSERDKANAAGQLAWLDRMRWRDWAYLEESLATHIGAKRVATPPLTAWRAENWATEPTTPQVIWERLGSHLVQAPPGYLEPRSAIDPLEETPVAGSVSADLPEPPTPGQLESTPVGMMP
jgi:hypothetical protein